MAAMMQPAPLGKHPSFITALAFSSKKPQLASGDYQGTVRLWDTNTGAPLATLVGFDLDFDKRPKMIDALAFSRDGKRLAVGLSDYDGEYRLRLWDLANQKEYARISCDEVDDLAFTADGTLLTACGVSLELRDGHTGEKRAAITGHQDHVICVAHNTEYKLLATGTAYEDGVVRVWNAASRTLYAIAGHVAGNVEQVWFTPDGEYLYWYGWDGLHKWDIQTKTELAAWANVPGGDRTTILDPARGVTAGVTSFDEAKEGGIGYDHSSTIRLVELSTGKVVNELPNAIDAHILTIAFSPNGKMLAFGDEKDRVFLWHLHKSP